MTTILKQMNTQLATLVTKAHAGAAHPPLLLWSRAVHSSGGEGLVQPRCPSRAGSAHSLPAALVESLAHCSSGVVLVLHAPALRRAGATGG